MRNLTIVRRLRHVGMCGGGRFWSIAIVVATVPGAVTAQTADELTRAGEYVQQAFQAREANDLQAGHSRQIFGNGDNQCRCRKSHSPQAIPTVPKRSPTIWLTSQPSNPGKINVVPARKAFNFIHVFLDIFGSPFLRGSL